MVSLLGLFLLPLLWWLLRGSPALGLSCTRWQFYQGCPREYPDLWAHLELMSD